MITIKGHKKLWPFYYLNRDQYLIDVMHSLNYPDMPNEVFIFPRNDIGREQGWEGLTLDDVPQVDDDQYHQTSKALEWWLFDFRVERTIEPEIVTIDVPVIPIRSFYDDLTFEWPTIPVEFSILCQT